MITKRLAIKIALFFLLLQTAKAQRTMIYDDNIRYYNRGLELFDKEKFAVAQKHFTWFAGFTTDRSYKARAEYYAATCAMELFNANAVSMLKGIFQNYPDLPVSKLAMYQLGRLYYRNKNNKEAVHYFDRVDADYLAENDVREYYFDKGYCLFKVDSFEKSKAALKPIKDEKTKYYDATNYYYGYVCYKNADYDEALDHFARVKRHKTFGPLSNIYVAQIYFSRKQYQDVIAYCDTITNNEVATDISGMLGQSHYNLGNYQKALPYLEKYTNEAPVAPNNNDVYRLAYSYFKNNQFEKAIDQFLKIAENTDTLTQYALYNLGKCYIEVNKKPNARTAFNKAAEIDYNKVISEWSIFNSAKLANELLLNSAAIFNYKKFIEKFPESDLIDEAKSNLSQLLLSSKNYKEAINFLESIIKPSDKDLLGLQRVYYYQAEQYYLNNDYENAAIYFNKAAETSYDKRILSLSYFWLGEIEYKNNAYQNAIANYKKALTFDELKKTRFYFLSVYNLGYAQLKAEEYNNAIEQFKKYVLLDAAVSNPEIYTDAVIRTADCYFVQRSYDKAIEYYNLVIDKKLNGADYAMYQKSLVQGVVNRNNDKITSLRSLINQFPKSVFIDDALFDIAKVHLQNEEYATAVSEFDNIITNYPRSIYIRKAMLNKGLALFNQDKDDDALTTIKTLIKTYPQTDESREALVLVRNILVNKGESEKLEDMYRNLPNISIAPSTQDSITYEAAFNNYKNNDCAKASKGFANYISRFPGGYFMLKANYFKAECDYKLKNNDDALACYEYVVSNTRSDYTERSTRQAAILYFGKKNYEKAYEYYAALERIAGNKDNLHVSLLGQMRCAGLMQKTDTAATASFKYINSGIAQKDGLVEARYNTGKFYISRNKPDSAMPDFQFVLKESKNVLAAESKYNIAYIQFLRKEFKGATKTITELSNQFTDYDYWVAKGFILWSDIYVKMNDLFQAKATLQSVLEGYEGDGDIKQIAQEKLNKVIELESKNKSEQKKKIEDRIDKEN